MALDPQVRAGGPLGGVRVLEIASIGPGPHCAMLLSDMGAEVLRIEREDGNGWPNPVMDRGRATLELDIRSPRGSDRALAIADRCDVLIEGFRPGVMERLGLGPDVLLERNPRLIIGRMTGWGQEGPLANAAAHDINYIAITGALAALGQPGSPPPPPLNLVGDFGGGSMFLTVGILAALFERERSGKGQVVDAAIVDGVTSMMSMFAGLLPTGRLPMERGRNFLGGAAPFYRCYACADGKYVAVGAIEPRFHAELLARLGLPAEWAETQMCEEFWPERTVQFARIFAARSRAEWCEALEGTDVCFAPVLDLEEAPSHPHMAARGAYCRAGGISQAAPAPRLSRTPLVVAAGTSGDERMRQWGIAPDAE